MRVLVACEFSGIVREAFAKRGHDAWSCDLLPTEIPGKHIQGDIRTNGVLDDLWDLLIAHPTCTRLTNSGVMWLDRRDLWDDLFEATEFFRMFLDANCPKICVENPIPHKYAVEYIGDYTQLIQPYQFGHLERKATCLWLKNLPLLVETNNVKEEMERLPKNVSQRIHYTPPGPERWKIRSRTFPSIAAAMADQWGSLPRTTSAPPSQIMELRRGKDE